MRSKKQENRVEISDFVPDFNFDWSIFRKENIRLTTRRECEFVVNSFLLENNSGKRCTEADTEPSVHLFSSERGQPARQRPGKALPEGEI